MQSRGVHSQDPVSDSRRIPPPEARTHETERERARESERYDQNEVSAKPSNWAPDLVCEIGRQDERVSKRESEQERG